jgi:predicted nicotinamide N-methyase
MLSRRENLLRRIRARYQIITERLTVGSLELDFTRIADPNRVLDEVAEEEDRLEKVTGVRVDGDYLHLPYWAELWDSAAGVGEFLMKRRGKGETGRRGEKIWESAAASSPLRPFSPFPLLVPSPRVLDLGCGMGLAGTVAAGLGARVLFADLEPPALLFAQLNSLPYARRVRTRRVDWRVDRLGETFDLIVGSDILYERKQWDHLEPFWRRHLAPGGTVLLGEPGRQTGDRFPDWIATRGWTLWRFEQRVEDRGKTIRLFVLTQSEGADDNGS